MHVEMYAYSHDPETGGLLLSTMPEENMKEPRPVYAAEMDLLGFDDLWIYEKQNEVPYMWAEAQYYWYRGKRIAKTVGGSIYEKPELVLELDEDGLAILPIDSQLLPVDMELMLQKNSAVLASLERTSILYIWKIYKRFSRRLDCFHVAYSGGKDSTVLLELVKRALPKKDFLVIFGDTGMEFPDTYDFVAEVEKECLKEDIPFWRAKSHFAPEQSWKLFGPPSQNLRWCCSVHKSTPQILKIREILNKNAYAGMDIVGVRRNESEKRAGYKKLDYGKKCVANMLCIRFLIGTLVKYGFTSSSEICRSIELIKQVITA